MLLGVPSARVAGTRKRARPRRPGSAPSGRARVAIALASTLEQNHLEPLSSQRFSPPPGAGRAVVSRGRQVGAAAQLGHEHRAVPAVVEGGRQQVRHQLLADARRGVAVDEGHDAVRHAGGADHSGVRLAEEIGEGAGEDGRHLLALRLQGVRALLPDVALGVDGAGVVRDARRLVAPGVVALQARRVAVDHLGVGGDGPAADLAPAVEALLRPAAVLRREVLVHEGAQVGVELVPVEADGGVELGVIDRFSHGAPRSGYPYGVASLAGAAEVVKGGGQG